METKFIFQAFQDASVNTLSKEVNDFVTSHQWKELMFYPTSGVAKEDGSLVYITSISGLVYVTK